MGIMLSSLFLKNDGTRLSVNAVKIVLYSVLVDCKEDFIGFYRAETLRAMSRKSHGMYL